jgi:2-methylcitrate dehydratase PrpD
MNPAGRKGHACVAINKAFSSKSTEKRNGGALGMFTRKLSEFITRTGYEDLPLEVVTAAKAAILDFIGVAMAGSAEASGKITNEMVKEYKSVSEAAVIGGRFKASCSLAALANGTAGHVLDYDDCLDFPHVGLGHPTTGILPAALAISEKFDATGRDLITAYCLGIEAYAKIGLFAKDAFRADKGWEWTGVLGVMGATASVAKLLNLDAQETCMSFGIAASLSCGLTRNFGSMAGHWHAGNAARNGVEAAALARKGFISSDDIIEAPSGFYNLFTGNQGPATKEDMEENIRALGNPWNIVDPGLMLKAFPCAHISHFGVDAALQLKQKHAIDWRQIAEIEFRIPSLLRRIVSYPDPRTGLEAKFSPGHCMCRALIYGEIKIADFRDESVKNPSLTQLMNRIKWVVIDQEPGKLPFGYQEVVLKMEDGRTFACKVSHPKGEPQNPQTEEDSTTKYEDCATHGHYDNETASQIKDMILNLESVVRISQLADLFLR